MKQAMTDTLERCRTLPSLSPLAVRIDRICQLDNYQMTEIALAINADEVLAQRVLALNGLPLFGDRRKYDSIEQAMMLQGITSLRFLVNAVSMAGHLRDGGRKGFDYERFWRRAALRATITTMLARHTAQRRLPEVFFCALVQDIGMLAMAQAFPDRYGTLVSKFPWDEQLRTKKEGESFGGCPRSWILALP